MPLPRAASPLSAALANAKKTKTGPLWEGPCAPGRNGGVTQGLLGRYLVCPERCRVHAFLGIRPADTFSHRLEYGNMWHVCERAHAAAPQTREPGWEHALMDYSRQLLARYPIQQQGVDHWYNVCRTQFPLYVDHWARHPDVRVRKPLLQERAFAVPYPLASGRTVILRGRWDSVDLVRDGGRDGLWLQENKTKGEINEGLIQQQLKFDLQTMLYLVALETFMDRGEMVPKPDAASECPMHDVGATTLGVRYNVVRRPLSGGRGSIVRGKGTKGRKCSKCDGTGLGEPDRRTGRRQGGRCHKCGGAGRVGSQPPESKDAYYSRLGAVIAAEPESYFMRWNSLVTHDDLATFRRQCLDPALENLCDDYEWWVRVEDEDYNPYDYPSRAQLHPDHYARHYRLPYGVYNPMADGRSGDLGEYLDTGSTVGLRHASVCYPELED